MMDFSFLDENEKIEQDESEDSQLRMIADNIGSYFWSYKPEFASEYGTDQDNHIGIIAQELLKVPGLDSAVVMDQNGIYKVKTDYLALASLGLIAALARKVLGNSAENNMESRNGAIEQEVPAGIPAGEEQTVKPVQTVDKYYDEGKGEAEGTAAEMEPAETGNNV